MKLKQIILILTLSIIILIIININYPPYSIYTEGMKSYTNTDISNLQIPVNDYNNVVNGTICDNAISNIKKLRIQSIQNIINDNDKLSNCEIIDKISVNNSNDKRDPRIIKIINNCFGAKYTEVLNMLTTIQSSELFKNDEKVSLLIKNIASSPTISGVNSSVDSVNQYIKIMETINTVDSLTKPTETPQK
jgi:hypothetical protein